jgi:hypothetical protein
MAKRLKQPSGPAIQFLTESETSSATPVGGVSGPGRWLVLRYLPVSLFSLKASYSTSGVGRTLLVPSPYTVKMAILDAGLTSGLIVGESVAELLVLSLREATVRIGVPQHAVVTHTIVKVRQEPKTPKEGEAYIPNVAYREFVYFSGDMQLAFDLHTLHRDTAEAVCSIAPVVRYMGKRGSFFQFQSIHRIDELTERFTNNVDSLDLVPNRAHLAWLDDFGPQASFNVLNSYSSEEIKREKHRRFVHTVVPLGRTNSGPGFSHYQVHSNE